MNRLTLNPQRLALLLLVLCPCLALGQGTTVSQAIVVSNSLGRPLGGVSVEICTTVSPSSPACSSAASIFSDSGLTVPITCSGPTTCLTTDSLGRVPTFFALPGNYCYTVSGSYITDTSCQLIVLYSATAGTAVITGPAGAQNVTQPGSTSLGVNRFETQRFPDQFSGSDLGAKTNSAYTDAGALGASAFITAQTSCQNFSTPITLSTIDKLLNLSGSGPSTCLHYTASTGCAITIDTAPHHQPYELSNLKLTGPGSGTAAEGICLGTANSLDQFKIENVYVSGFGTGVDHKNNSFDTTIENSTILGNGTGVLYGSGAETPRIINSVIAQNATGVSVTSGTVDLYLAFNSIDDNTTCAIAVSAASTVHLYGNHFENAGQGTECYGNVSNSGAKVFISGGQMLEDITTGAATQFWTQGGGYFEMYGTELFSAGRTITQAINVTNGNAIINATNISPTAIANEVNFSGIPGRAYNLPSRSDAGSINWKTKNYNLFVDNVSSNGTSPALSGIFRMAKSDTGPCWRNNANSADICFNLSGTDAIQSNGSFNINLVSPVVNTGVTNSGTGFKHVRSATTCTTAASIGATCTSGAISWPGSAFADVNYTLTCTITGAVTNVPVVETTARSTGSFTVTIAALTAAAASYAEVDCIGVHD